MRLRTALLLALTLAACAGRHDPFHDVTAGRPYGRVLAERGADVVAYDDERGTCFGYHLTASAGGRCMVSGWAVEAALAEAGEGTYVLLLAGDERTAEVQVPRKNGPPLSVPLRRVPHAGHPVAALVVDPADLVLSGNAVAGYDAGGRLLGHTHECAGGGAVPDCGPWSGPVDEHLRSTFPTPS
jgi:hypothetical protein